MADPLARLRRFFRELKRRHVYKVAAAYAVVAFVVVEASDLVFPALNIPSWVYSLVVILALLGFPVALVLGWVFDLTPEGVDRTAPTEDGAPGPGSPSPAGDLFRGRLAVTVLAGLGLLAAAAGGWYLTGGGDGKSFEPSEGTVAVLPFEVSGSGADTWRDGMVTMLNTGLDGTAGLRTIADRTVFAAWEESGRARGGASTEQALAVARQVGAQYAVVGSAVKLGSELRFVAEIHESRSGDRLGRTEVRGPADSVTSLADRLARRTLGFLLGRPDQKLPSVDLKSLTTPSLPALKAFLAGERHLRAGEYGAAIEDYEAAAAVDSTFALAYARLGLARWWTGAGSGEVAAWKRAYRLADRLSSRERRMVRALYLSRVQGRDVAAADSLRRLTDDYRDDPTLWYNLGEVLFHGRIPRGWPEADGAFERAIRLDPGHALYYPHFAQLGIAVQHDSALAAERIAAIPNEGFREAYRIPLDLAFGTPATRRNALARLDTIPLTTVLGLGTWFSLRHPAQRDAYEVMLERLRERARSEEVFGGRLQSDLVANSFLQGQVREGTSRLGAGWAATCRSTYLASVGGPAPDSLARTELAPSLLAEDASRTRLRCAALSLIHQDRGDEADRLIARLQERAASGDTVPPRARAAIDEIEGYRAWRAGDLEEAARLLSGRIPGDSWVPGTGALWRGDLHREMGQLEEAEGWYMAAWEHPVAHERLGRLYEEMDRPEKAAAAYGRFIAGWADADEELQPLVEGARERLRKLSGSRTESSG